MLELCLLDRSERRLALPWMRGHQARDLPRLLDQLIASGTRFMSVGDLLAVRRGVAESSDAPELALAVQGDSRFVLSAVAAILERDLPCMALATVAKRQGHPGFEASHGELRMLREWGVPIECSGLPEWEQGRWSVEHVYGAMLRVRRELERAVGRAPVLYNVVTRKPPAEFFDLLARAGFELSSGEPGCGAAIDCRCLRDHARERSRLAAG